MKFSSMQFLTGLLAAFGLTVAMAQTGNNGAKVGAGGFLLNVIAFEQCPSGEFQGSNRHQIAVQGTQSGNGQDSTARTNKIMLSASENGDFWVEDGNACLGDARFHLPVDHLNCAAPCDLEEPTFTQYEVRMRLVGQPGGKVSITSCVLETEDDSILVDSDETDTDAETLCSVESNVWAVTRTVGNGKTQNRFENVSKELLTVCVDTTDDGVSECDERIGLFDERGEEYWWNWDAYGRPHVQLVFVPVQSGST
ncbi:MAG TPA: hypothetical protein VKQ06_04030 [Gammaproteobacteria bacterium]|nr:hypothetical protein [Gammaproteobacteria bacterium]